MRAVEFIVEGYREAQQEFSQVHNNPEEVKDTISKYRNLVDRNQVQGEERNIDAWRKKGWANFKNFVDQKSTEVSRSQVKRAKIPGGDEAVLVSNKDWHITVPLNKAASCNIGSNTDWCTTKFDRTHYERYEKEGVVLVYCIRADRKKWAVAIYPEQYNDEHGRRYEIFDQQDNSIDDAEFYQQTGGLTVHMLEKLALSNPKVAERERKRTELPFDVIPADQMHFSNYSDAVKYCHKLGNGWRLPTQDEAEKIMAAIYRKQIKTPISHCWTSEVYEWQGYQGKVLMVYLSSDDMIENEWIEQDDKSGVIAVRSKKS